MKAGGALHLARKKIFPAERRDLSGGGAARDKRIAGGRIGVSLNERRFLGFDTLPNFIILRNRDTVKRVPRHPATPRLFLLSFHELNSIEWRAN